MVVPQALFPTGRRSAAINATRVLEVLQQLLADFCNEVSSAFNAQNVGKKSQQMFDGAAGERN